LKVYCYCCFRSFGWMVSESRM